MLATATAIVSSGGVVTGLLITNPGNGYLTPPTATIAPPASGMTATAAALITTPGRATPWPRRS